MHVYEPYGVLHEAVFTFVIAKVCGCLMVILIALSSDLAKAEMPTQVDPPSIDQVSWLIESLMDEEPPVLKPFDFPKEVDRSDTQQVTLLDVWFKKGLLTRELIRFNAVKEVQGRKRLISISGYRYDLDVSQPSVSTRGLVYGQAKIKRIISISAPSFITYTFFSEVYLQWYVDNIADWAQTPLMLKSYRELRRSKESFEKPFEKRFYFEYQEDVGWVLWKEKPRAMVQPLF
jgi:hypothetical protein